MPRKTNKTSHVLNLITNGVSPESEEIPAEQEENSQEQEKIPAGREETPVKQEETPAGREETPVRREEIPAGREETPVKREEIPTGREEAPVKREEIPAGREEAPVKREEIPAGHEESAGQTQITSARIEEPAAPKRAEEKELAPRLSSSGDKTVIVVDETSKSHQISSQILDRLTDQLEEELQKKTINYHMVNVMEQILHRMNLPHHMELYGVCMCSRCQSDVLALILTRLPAKYVVVDESVTAPIIGFYESKFRVRILTEVIKACIDVKDNPRHNNDGPYDG